MKKKNHGFTLIELLAVIVILAVIALIIVPLVMSTINDAKKSSFRDSAYGIIESAYQYVTIKRTKDYDAKLEEKIELPDHSKINHKGTEPEGGTIWISEEGNIALVMYNDKYCAIKEINHSDVVVQNYSKNTCKLKEEIEDPIKVKTSVELYNEDQYASIKAEIKSTSPIKTVKYMKGQVEETVIAKEGTEMHLSNNHYVVNDIATNGYYTIFVEDTKGNTISNFLIVEGIVVLEGNFEDRYVNGSFGELNQDWGKWERTLNIETKNGVKIIDARYTKKYKYDSITDFETNQNFGEKINFDETKLNYSVSGVWLQCVTIYVKYEYQEEVEPGVFEKKYASKLYKSRFSNIFQ